jgi:hypothetical protein
LLLCQLLWLIAKTIYPVRSPFFGYDPCLNATKDFWYSKFSEVSVEFSVEDLDNNPLHYCHVRKCGVRQLHTQAENDCDFILPYCKVFAATPTEFRQLVQQFTNAGGRKNLEMPW